MPRSLRFILLLVIPFLVYAPAIFHDYGFRDDYSLTREAHEEPGKVLNFTASHGRPLYGAILEESFSRVEKITDLAVLRVMSVLLLTLFGWVLWRQLQSSGWPVFDAVIVAALVVFLPASQVTASWTVGWPWGFSLAMAVVAYGLVESAWIRQGYARQWRLFAAVLVYMATALIYQSNALFAVVLVAATLLSPQSLSSQSLSRQSSTLVVNLFHWLCFHLFFLLLALLLSYGLLKGLFAEDVFHASGRLQFETDPWSKLKWFLSLPVPNALAFFVLRDDFQTGATQFWCVVTAVCLLLGYACMRQAGQLGRIKWLLCFGVLPWVAHAISLVAAERALGYRTQFAISGLAVVMVIAALREVWPSGNVMHYAQEKIRHVVLSLFVVLCAALASYQSYHLIAFTQGNEWRLIMDAVNKINPSGKTVIYLIEPALSDRSTTRVYRDEFGSLSSNSSWAPDEMFKAALHERFPAGLPGNWQYEFWHGGEPPDPADHYDMVIDMRELRHWR